MQKLTKKDRKRFDDVCRTIREALHIDHWRVSYMIDAKPNEDAAATYWHYDEGDYITIYFRPAFWEETDTDWQLRALIHEHVHAVLSPLVQAYNKISNRLHIADTELAKGMYGGANEHVTCHLEGVLYDLLKDRF